MVNGIQIVVGTPRYYNSLETYAWDPKESNYWSCGKKTKAGDTLLFYITAPKSRMVASAVASSDAWPDKQWNYAANIKNVKILKTKRQVTLQALKKNSGWGWPKQPRMPTYPPDSVVKDLLKLTNVKKEIIGEKILSSAGAGFGTPEENFSVEKAACKAVKDRFGKKGHKVVSKEKENLGHDFEVKGVSGPISKFIITVNEVKCAQKDPHFRLAVVTNARKSPAIHIYASGEFFKKFRCNPSAYFAKKNKSCQHDRHYPICPSSNSGIKLRHQGNHLGPPPQSRINQLPSFFRARRLFDPAQPSF